MCSTAAHELVGFDLGNLLESVKFFPVIPLAFHTGINDPILKMFTIALHFKWVNLAHMH